MPSPFVKCPLALKPEPQLSTRNTQTQGSRLAQHMSWSQSPRTPLSPFRWSASVLHYGDHPHCQVGFGPSREYSNIGTQMFPCISVTHNEIASLPLFVQASIKLACIGVFEFNHEQMNMLFVFYAEGHVTSLIEHWQRISHTQILMYNNYT